MVSIDADPPTRGRGRLGATSTTVRQTLPWLVGAAVVLAVFVPLAADASALVWSGALALGVAFAPTAIGVFLTFRVLDFPDLTVDASFPAGAAAAATIISNGGNPWLATAAAFAVGSGLGAITGLAHLGLRINSLLASILTVTAAYTINLRLQGQANLSLLGTETLFSPLLGTLEGWLDALWGATGVQLHRNATTLAVALGFLVVTIVGLSWFMRTEQGIALQATGANPRMSRSCGIDTRRYLVAGVAFSNGLVGVSGAMIAQHQGFADVNSGAGLIIAGLAAVITGEVLFGGPEHSLTRNLIAVSIGMIVYRAAISLTLAANIDLPLLDPIKLDATDVRLATACIVALMLAIPVLKRRRAQGRVRGLS